MSRQIARQPDGLYAGFTDPGLPPCVFEISGDARIRMVLRDAEEEARWQRLKDSPEFAEDLASLTESRDFITFPGEMTPPGKCEACGTLVTFVPEERYDARGEREPALWESGLWRKHTPRRCNVMRRDG
jgi:hypothetical protein